MILADASDADQGKDSSGEGVRKIPIARKHVL